MITVMTATKDQVEWAIHTLECDEETSEHDQAGAWALLTVVALGAFPQAERAEQAEHCLSRVYKWMQFADHISPCNWVYQDTHTCQCGLWNLQSEIDRLLNKS